MHPASNRRKSDVPSSPAGRLICLIILLLAVLAAGGIYYLALTRTGFAFRCIFHEITGLLCPGCGVTRMCLSLIHGDFAGAFAANPALLALSPVLTVCFGACAVRYVRTGSKRPPRWVEYIMWFCIVVLMIFCVARNIV